MNYEKIYNQIIERAKTRILVGYKERHHIMPRCLGGNNSKDNLVLLTAREHFICHALLAEIYLNNDKIQYAIWMMCHTKSGNQLRNYNVSSRQYEVYKLRISSLKLGKKDSLETRKKKSLCRIGKPSNHKKGSICVEKTRLLISNKNKGRIPWNKGKKMSIEFCDKVRNNNLGRKQTAEHINNRVKSYKSTKTKLNEK